MIKCPICGQSKPFPRLTEDHIRSRTTGQLKTDVGYWERQLREAQPQARHWNKLRHRAMTRIDRLTDEIFRRGKNQRQNPKRVLRRAA